MKIKFELNTADINWSKWNRVLQSLLLITFSFCIIAHIPKPSDCWYSWPILVVVLYSLMCLLINLIELL